MERETIVQHSAASNILFQLTDSVAAIDMSVQMVSRGLPIDVNMYGFDVKFGKKSAESVRVLIFFCSMAKLWHKSFDEILNCYKLLFE